MTQHTPPAPTEPPPPCRDTLGNPVHLDELGRVPDDPAANRDRFQARVRRNERVFISLIALLALLAMVLGSLGCVGSRSINYDPSAGFSYTNQGQDTAFGALDVQRRTITETIDPETGAVTQRVTEETTVVVDAYQGTDAMARAVMQAAEAVKEVVQALPTN